MKTRALPLVLVAIALALPIAAAEPAKDEAPPKQATKEEIQARLAEHHRKKEEKSLADKEAAAKAAKTSKEEAATTAAPVATAKDDKATAEPKKEATQLLPKVEVKKDRLTELDYRLAEQNFEIAREKANTKPTALDETLNGPKISKALAIFGGQSSDDRANVAKERVAMMEDEKEVIEAIAHAATAEEKAELEKLLASMRDTRRELEKSLK